MSFSLIEGDVTLRSSAGNEIGSILDGSIYRLQTQSLLIAGDDVVGRVKLTDGTEVADVGTDNRLQVGSLLAIGDNLAGRVKISDGTEVVDVGTDNRLETGAELRAGTALAGSLKLRGHDGTYDADILQDAADNVRRLQIAGKVSLVAQDTPSTATELVVDASSPLIMSGTKDTDSSAIPSGKTVTAAFLGAGTEGDPAEGGSVVEFYWVTSGPTLNLIERIYVRGSSVFATPATQRTRNGSLMTSTGTEFIRVRRRRLSGASLEVDGVLRGWYE